MTMESSTRCSAVSPEGENGQQWQCDREPDDHGSTLDDPHEAGWVVYWSDHSELRQGRPGTVEGSGT